MKVFSKPFLASVYISTSLGGMSLLPPATEEKLWDSYTNKNSSDPTAEDLRLCCEAFRDSTECRLFVFETISSVKEG